MRYSVTGVEQSTGRRVTREVVCDSEQEATASATLDGIAVEQVTAVGPVAPKPKAPAEWPGAEAVATSQKYRELSYGPDWGSTWGFLALGAAIIAGGVYVWQWEQMGWVGVLAAPFAVVCLAAGLLNRRNFVKLTDRGVRYRLRRRPEVHIPYIRIHGVKTRSFRTPGVSGPGALFSIALVLENGDEYEIARIARLEEVGREIASRAKLPG
jgi:hypothetical protein